MYAYSTKQDSMEAKQVILQLFVLLAPTLNLSANIIDAELSGNIRVQNKLKGIHSSNNKIQRLSKLYYRQWEKNGL